MTSYSITYNDQKGGFWWRSKKSEVPKPSHQPQSIMERNARFKQQHQKNTSSGSPRSPSPDVNRAPSASPRSPSPTTNRNPNPITTSSPGRVNKDMQILRDLSKTELQKAQEIKRQKLVDENLKHLEDLFSFDFTSPSRSVWRIDGNNLTYQKRDVESKFSRKISVTIDKNKIIDLIKNIHSFIKLKGNQQEKDQANSVIQRFKENYNTAIKAYLVNSSGDKSLDKYFVVLVRLITYAANHNKDLNSSLNILNKYIRETDEIKALSLLVKILLTDLPKEESNSILTKMGLADIL